MAGMHFGRGNGIRRRGRISWGQGFSREHNCAPLCPAAAAFTQISLLPIECCLELTAPPSNHSFDSNVIVKIGPRTGLPRSRSRPSGFFKSPDRVFPDFSDAICDVPSRRLRPNEDDARRCCGRGGVRLQRIESKSSVSIPPARRARFFALILALFVASAASIIPASATPALVVDADTQAVLYADDAGRPWYPTSTTKLMTAFVTFEALAAGEVTLDTPVVMSPKAMHQESLHAGLSVRRAMRLEDAFYAAFAASANDVAIALAQMVAGTEKAFVER